MAQEFLPGEQDGPENKNERVVQQIIREQKLTLSIPEAARRLGISDTTMRQLVRTAGFPSFNVGQRILVSAKGLETWVEEQAKKGLQI